MENNTFKSKSKVHQSSTVYIGNMSYKRDEFGIKKLFLKYGKVKSLELITVPGSGQSKGYAFVKMFRHEDALKAIKNLNGKIVDGRCLKVSMAIESNNKISLAPKKKVEPIAQVETKKKEKKIKVKKKAKGLDELLNFLTK